MKLHSERNNGRQGTALFSVMMLTFVISAGVAVLASAGLSRAFMAVKLADRIRAGALAEAGVSYAYTVLSTNFAARTNGAAFPAVDYGGGTYDVGVVAVDDHAAVIQCAAEYNTGSELVILDIVHLPGMGGGPGGGAGNAYQYNVYADGTISWTGCGEFLGQGMIHANDTFKQGGSGELDADVFSSTRITLRGSSGYIGGDCTAPTVDGKTEIVAGVIRQEPVTVIPMPVIDLAPYYNHALANGEVYDGRVSIGSDCAPAGGIMWVNGNLKITSQANLTGCFIATGYIDISSSGHHRKVAGYPAFVSRDGYIKVTSQFHFEGLIYTRVGDVDFAGGGRLDGSIVCGGNFKKSGNSTIFNWVDATPVPPGGTQGGAPIAVVTWQR